MLSGLTEYVLIMDINVRICNIYVFLIIFVSNILLHNELFLENKTQ